MKKLSIITINYNNLEGLKKTVASVVNQTWQDFEYIIIDGGSTDGSANFLDTQKEQIDYWISEPDKGVYNAMNKGIEKSTGEYILFLNSGDLLFNETVFEQNIFKVKVKDLVCFDILIRDQKNEFIKRAPEFGVLSYLSLDTFPHQSVFIKKKLFETVGLYDEDLKIVADWKFFIHAIVFHKATYEKINELLSIYYLDGISSDPANRSLLMNERRKVLNNDFPYLNEFFIESLKKENTIKDLRQSNKINWLIKLKLLNKF